jgi:hypothetical protein
MTSREHLLPPDTGSPMMNPLRDAVMPKEDPMTGPPRRNENRFYRYPKNRIVAVLPDDGRLNSALGTACAPGCCGRSSAGRTRWTCGARRLVVGGG